MANVVVRCSVPATPTRPSSTVPGQRAGAGMAVLRRRGAPRMTCAFLGLGTVGVMRRLYPREISRRVGPIVPTGTGERAASGAPALLLGLGATDAAPGSASDAVVRAIAGEVAGGGRLDRGLAVMLVGFEAVEWPRRFSGPVADRRRGGAASGTPEGGGSTAAGRMRRGWATRHLPEAADAASTASSLGEGRETASPTSSPKRG